jgi:hypothetical protein
MLWLTQRSSHRDERDTNMRLAMVDTLKYDGKDQPNIKTDDVSQ